MKSTFNNIMYVFSYALKVVKIILIILATLSPFIEELPVISNIYSVSSIDIGCIFSSRENLSEGYTKTFEYMGKEYKEYKQDLLPWMNISYWESTIEKSGCGPTTLAIIGSGYNRDETPKSIATYMNNIYGHTHYNPLSYTLKNKLGLENTVYLNNFEEILESDVESDALVALTRQEEIIASNIKNTLLYGKPVLVSVSSGEDNKYTKSNHIMALLGMDDKDEVYISNPFTKSPDDWTNLKELINYINYYITIDS